MSPEQVAAIVNEILDSRLGDVRTSDSPLPVADAAEYLGVRKGKLDEMRMTGVGPDYYRVGRRIFYRQESLDAYVDANTHRHTAEYEERR